MAAKRKKKAVKAKKAAKANGHSSPRLPRGEKPARISGDSLRRMREKAGIQQHVLATRIGCSQPHISNIERGVVVPSEKLAEQYKRACS